MTTSIESAFRQLLSEIVHEVATRIANELDSKQHVLLPPPPNGSLLLTARETAKRLAISERHLHGLTRLGQLPCVRVGNCVRYNAETIQKWVRDTESIDRPSSTEKSESKQSSPRSAASRRKPEAVKRRKQPVRRTKLAAPQLGSLKVAQPKSKGKPREVQSEERISPVSILLSELGVDRSDLPPITDGDLRRVAEVDIPTIHGWLYLGRSLPEAAMVRLKNHYLRLVKERKDGD